MGYSNTDAFSGTAASSTLTGTAAGTITTVGIGTGTLIIPGGATFTNILQGKTTQKVNVSLAFGFVTATVTTVDYNYYHSSQKFPLLTVSYSNAQGALTNSSATVKVNTSVITGINDLNFDASFNVFPNPAKDVINIKLHNANNDLCKVEIINSVGQLAQTINLGNDMEIANNISVSHLSSGIYMVKTTLGNKVSSRKLIIE
jgi:hypothetical protein